MERVNHQALYPSDILPHCAAGFWSAPGDKSCSKIPVSQAFHLEVQQYELHLEMELNAQLLHTDIMRGIFSYVPSFVSEYLTLTGVFFIQEIPY
jgi:hypothetical protein